MPNILSKTNLCRVELLYAHCLKGCISLYKSASLSVSLFDCLFDCLIVCLFVP